MIDEKPDSELDNFFRRELENLPEEKPSARDWQQMSYRLQSEGLNGNGHSSNGKKYFLLILLSILLSGLVSLPFVMRDKNTAMTKEFVNPLAKTENKAGGNASEKIIQTSSAPAAAENVPVIQSSTKHFASQNKISGTLFSKERSVKNKAKENYSDQANIPASETLQASVPPSGEGARNYSGNQGETTASTREHLQTGAPLTADISQIQNIPAQVTALNSVNPDESMLQPDSTCIRSLKTIHAAEPQNRLRLGIYASLDYNYYTLKRNSSVSSAESDYVSQSNNIKGEGWNGQYTVGVIGGFLFTEKLALEGGVFYSQKKQLHTSVSTPAYALKNSSEEYSDFKYDFRARYFEMYGRVKYYFYQRKNSLYATVGAAGSFDLPVRSDSSDYFLRTSYSESAKAETQRVTLNASSAGLILVLSGGIEIPFCSRWNLYIEPTYRYSFDPVIKHPFYDQVPVEHFMRCMSLATGVMYKF